jgi:hypothetical protein
MATVFLGWDEPLRLADHCRTRASITLPAGWVFDTISTISGQTIVSQGDRYRVVVQQPSDAERFVRPTFAYPAKDLDTVDSIRASARIERICDGAPAGTVDVGLEVEASGFSRT